MVDNLFIAGNLLLGAIFWLSPLVLAIVALSRYRRIGTMARRIEQLEALVGRLVPPSPDVSPVSKPVAIASPSALPARLPTTGLPAAPTWGSTSFDWEGFIGRRAMGWVAVLVTIFAAAFFLRYAVENRWVGPLGRVALAGMTGMALALGGLHDHRLGWRIFAAMLTGTGLVVIDHNNPPLEVQSATLTAPARQVVFARPADDAGVLRLYVGNPKASSPEYDFARNLPIQLDPQPARLALGPPRDNPAYRPTPPR
jgi:hypothetical protein